jgi:hypothetical protein
MDGIANNFQENFGLALGPAVNALFGTLIYAKKTREQNTRARPDQIEDKPAYREFSIQHQ